jgi:hypothetical protein
LPLGAATDVFYSSIMSHRLHLAAVSCVALCLASGACSDGGTDAGDVDMGAGSDASSETDSDPETSDETETGTDGGDGDGDMQSAAELVLPRTLALPYVSAGAGGSMGAFQIVNLGDLVAEGLDGAELSWSLEGDERLSLVEAPSRVEAGAEEMLVLAFAGADEQAIASATLSVEVGNDSLSATVFAVAGDPDLPAAEWETVELPGGHGCGRGLTIELPTAPFPHPSAGFTDDRVRIFVPDDSRDVGVQDLVVHFHGHSTDLDATLAGHRYEQHLCASGVNGILVVPQGPVQTASGNFGKLMDPGGLAALVQQVMVVLYREGSIVSPQLGELVLTAHSGGYVAVATNLDPAVNALPVAHVHLYDAIYGYASRFVDYVEAGGVLRSNYTPFGGTVEQNQQVIASLDQAGVAVVTEPTQRALRDAPVIIYAADTSHGGATRIDGAFGEQLRFALRHHRRGPRVELREAHVEDGVAEVRWFSPHDAGLTGFAVLTSVEGNWTVAAEVSADEEHATFPFSGAARIRVVPRLVDLSEDEVLGSDIYRLAQQPQTLIVDGFDRSIDGSFGGLTHDFSAVVGEAAGAVASVSNEALTEDGFDLTPWTRTIWLLGDESTADHSLSPLEQQLVSDYLAAGGTLVMSGSEVAFELDGSNAGATLLSDVFGAAFVNDDGNSHAAIGTGALMNLGSVTFAGLSAPYDEDFPDVLTSGGTGELVLLYDNGDGAGVGVAARAVLVGFPLELIDAEDDRAASAPCWTSCRSDSARDGPNASEDADHREPERQHDGRVGQAGDPPRRAARNGELTRGVLGEQLDHFPVERKQILRTTARHPVVVTHDLGVLPEPTGVADVVRDAWPGREAPPPNAPGGDQHLRSVTDHRDGAAEAVHLLDELARRLALAQQVRAHEPAREQQRGVVCRIGVGDQLIDWNLATSPDEVHAAQAPATQRENSNLGACSLQRPDWTRDLELLEPVRGEHGDGDSAQWFFVHELFWHRSVRRQTHCWQVRITSPAVPAAEIQIGGVGAEASGTIATMNRRSPA